MAPRVCRDEANSSREPALEFSRESVVGRVVIIGYPADACELWTRAARLPSARPRPRLVDCAAPDQVVAGGPHVSEIEQRVRQEFILNPDGPLLEVSVPLRMVADDAVVDLIDGWNEQSGRESFVDEEAGGQLVGVDRLAGGIRRVIPRSSVNADQRRAGVEYAVGAAFDGSFPSGGRPSRLAAPDLSC